MWTKILDFFGDWGKCGRKPISPISLPVLWAEIVRAIGQLSLFFVPSMKEPLYQKALLEVLTTCSTKNAFHFELAVGFLLACLPGLLQRKLEKKASED